MTPEQEAKCREAFEAWLLNGNRFCCEPKDIFTAGYQAAWSAAQAGWSNIIPDRWRMYTADFSINGRCSVMLVRCDKDRDWWHTLSEDEKNIVPLYVSGVGATLENALVNAAAQATPPTQLSGGEGGE